MALNLKIHAGLTSKVKYIVNEVCPRLFPSAKKNPLHALNCVVQVKFKGKGPVFGLFKIQANLIS